MKKVLIGKEADGTCWYRMEREWYDEILHPQPEVKILLFFLVPQIIWVFICFCICQTIK